jgi:hypothetical protein
VRSRFLLGVGAWLLGVAAATTGSLYAIGQLGHDLLMQQSKQVSVSMVNSELALENSERRAPIPGLSPYAPLSVTPAHRLAKHKRSSKATPSANIERLMTSPDGTAVAACQHGQAYLVYVTPYNGFEADDVVRGPAAVASVIFRDFSGRGIAMRVSCLAGRPHATLSHLRPWHDE